MKKMVTIIVGAFMLLFPFVAFASESVAEAKQPEGTPPISQPLVREGDFSIKLAAELELGTPATEAEAADMLVKAGIVPENGWIPDYPVTPAILGQLQDSIQRSVSEGKLAMAGDEAIHRLENLASQMNLPTPAEGTAEGGGQAPLEPNTAVVGDYYAYQGPPIITYYPPPAPYLYLYAWVPYPVWWYGFWFPGFYICHNFTTVVVVNRGPVIVSNHFRDRITKRVVFVSPISGKRAGTRHGTILRTESGRTYKTLSQMRREAGGERIHARSPGSSNVRKHSRYGGFKSPEARKSAESIYSKSRERTMRSGRGTEHRSFRSNEHRRRTYIAPSRQHNVGRSAGRTYTAPNRTFSRRDGYRRVAPRAAPERSVRGPAAQSYTGHRGRSGRSIQSFNAPGRGEGRSFIAPRSHGSYGGGRIERHWGSDNRFFSGRGWRGR